MWSDRSAGQASGSLRQTLYEIRLAFGPHEARLTASRDMVELEGVRTDLEGDPDGAARALAAGREFLEGLDVRDDAFEEWLMIERARLAGPARPARTSAGGSPRGLPFLVQVTDLGGGASTYLPRALATEIARLIGDLAEIEVYNIAPSKTAMVAPVRGLRLAIEAARFGPDVHVVATVSNIAQRRVAWTKRARFPLDPGRALDSGDFLRLTFEAAEAAHAALALAAEPDSATWAQGRQAQAVRALFTFDRQQLLRADRLLRESIDVRPSAQAWGWWAFLKQTLVIERVATDFAAARAESEDCARRALGWPERNSTVSALVSQISAMVAMDPAAAMATAQEAVAINPQNPYAQYALAVALLRAGRLTEAGHHGRLAADTAAQAYNGFFFKGILGLIALAAGDFDTCLATYEDVASRAPQFRAPLRGLAVLSLAQGDHGRAERHLARLAKAEEGFTLDRLLHDDTYPAVTLRNMGLLKAAQARL